MAPATIATLVELLESLPAPAEEQVAEHVREHLPDLRGEGRWEELIPETQPSPVGAARRAGMTRSRGSGWDPTTATSALLMTRGAAIAREIEGAIIILPLVASGDMEDELLTANDAGKAIWDKLEGQHSLVEVVAAPSPEFEEAEDAAIERDVLGLVVALVARRMLVAA